MEKRNMSITGTCLDVVLTPTYFVIDASAKLINSRDCYNVFRLAKAQMSLAQIIGTAQNLALPLNFCKVITQFSSIPKFMQRISDLISGSSLATEGAIDRREKFNSMRVTDADRIYVGEEDHSIPNVVRFASTAFSAVADACGAFMFIRDQLGIDLLSKIATATANLPVFTTLAGYALDSVRNTFGVMGLVLCIADCVRDMHGDHGITYYTAAKAAACACRIAFIVLSTSTVYQYMILAQVAQTVACSLYLVRSAMRTYSI
jgi:hypothetical protein